MNVGRPYQLLYSPHISEKAAKLADEMRQHVFRVAVSATKREIVTAVEDMFDVKVEKVNLLNMKGKRKGAGRNSGRRKNWKKAYVTLQEGHDIQFSGTE